MLGAIVRQLSPFPDYCADRVISWHCDIDVDAASAIFFTVITASIGLIILGAALRWRGLSSRRRASLKLLLMITGIVLAVILPMNIFLHSMLALPLSILAIIVIWRYMRKASERLLRQK